jgi:hypothetical protein
METPVPNPTKLDLRLQPTPDYGTFGPGSDIAPKRPEPRKTIGRLRAFAVIAGIALALLVQLASSDKVRAAWEQIQDLLSLQGKPEPASPRGSVWP